MVFMIISLMPPKRRSHGDSVEEWINGIKYFISNIVLLSDNSLRMMMMMIMIILLFVPPNDNFVP